MEKSIFPKKELKATLMIFEKLNICTEYENMACKYYSNEYLKKLKQCLNCLKMFKKHLNMFYLPYHIDNLINLLNDLDFKFKVITITESRLTTKKD